MKYLATRSIQTLHPFRWLFLFFKRGKGTSRVFTTSLTFLMHVTMDGSNAGTFLFSLSDSLPTMSLLLRNHQTIEDHMRQCDLLTVRETSLISHLGYHIRSDAMSEWRSHLFLSIGPFQHHNAQPSHTPRFRERFEGIIGFVQDMA